MAEWGVESWGKLAVGVMELFDLQEKEMLWQSFFDVSRIKQWDIQPYSSMGFKYPSTTEWMMQRSEESSSETEQKAPRNLPVAQMSATLIFIMVSCYWGVIIADFWPLLFNWKSERAWKALKTFQWFIRSVYYLASRCVSRHGLQRRAPCAKRLHF